MPFVTRLPAPLREPLRRWWRARYGAPSEAEPLGVLPPDVVPADAGSSGAESSDAMPSDVVPCQGVPAEGTSAVAVPDERGTGVPEVDEPTVAYQARIAREKEIFADQVDVHALPAIFHYWSNRYLLPMELEFGARHPEDFLARGLLDAARRTGSAHPRFISLGSGNCDAEVRIAQALVADGLRDFTFECMDINPSMLERGRELARASGLQARVVPLQGDFNHWTPEGKYDGVMANQSLHHVLELEALLDAIAASLHPQGRFVVSDMIGRNGHQRWPEAKAIVQEFWRELPESHRRNLQLDRDEPEFLDWDCSVEGFEGVRAQDILPLLVERFGFETFLAFGNVIDPFIDRGFGHHFDPANERDLAFIDRVHARDEAELQAGTIKPTHMLATLGLDRGLATRYRGNLAPAFCVRTPD